MKTVTPPMTLDTLKFVCFSYFHSKLSYWPIFWENSVARNKALNIKRQISRIIAGDKSWLSCTKSFRRFTYFRLQTNTYYAYYHLQLETQERNTNVKNINTRHKYDHIPNANLTKFQEIYYTDIKLLCIYIYTWNNFSCTCFKKFLRFMQVYM
jgi:hypothetical protein